MIVQWLDIVALWIIWWCAFAGLVGGHEVRTWRGLLLAMGLLTLMVSAFAGAIAVYMQQDLLPIWASGLVYGTAIVAVWLYDARFGVSRHLQMTLDAAVCLWRRVHRRLA